MFGHDRGQSTVELALILPVFVVMLALVVDGGRAYYRYFQVQQVAREAAFFGATHGGDVSATRAEAMAHAAEMGLELSHLEVDVQGSSNSGRAIIVTVTYHIDTILLGIAGYPSLSLRDRAKAMVF